MKITHPNLHLCVLLLLPTSTILTVSYPRFSDFPTFDDPSITYTYTRFPEIEHHCSSIIAAASDLKPNDNRGDRMKKELSFVNGDWYQEPNEAPLMPFHSHDPYNDGLPFKLVSFWLMDVDPTRRANNTVSVSGLMAIRITRSGSLYKPSGWLSSFHVQQGQRLMCLLGNASIPRPSDNVDSEENMYRPNFHSQHSTAQDKIMLVLRYPETFSLTTRAIRGEMTSLNHGSNPAYFNKIHISSQQGSYSKYQFGSEELLQKSCNPYPYRDYLAGEGIQMFKGEITAKSSAIWCGVKFLSSSLPGILLTTRRNLGHSYLIESWKQLLMVLTSSGYWFRI